MVVFRDYYPFGMEIGGRNYTDAQGYRYGYQGKYAEKDPETGWNAFELRMYDSRIGRWLSIDPEVQYHSPYVGMGNDPVNGVDPDGGFWQELGNFFRHGMWISNAGWQRYKVAKSQGYNNQNVKYKWIGSRLKGYGIVSYASGITDEITLEAYKFNAVKDYFSMFQGIVYAVYPNLEMKLSLGLQAGFKLPLKLGEVNLNLISYDLYKYSFIDKDHYHIFNKSDRQKNLNFSSSVDFAIYTVGGGVGVEYDFKKKIEFSGNMGAAGLTIEIVKDLMLKDAATKMGLGIGGLKSCFNWWY